MPEKKKSTAKIKRTFKRTPKEPVKKRKAASPKKSTASQSAAVKKKTAPVQEIVEVISLQEEKQTISVPVDDNSQQPTTVEEKISQLPMEEKETPDGAESSQNDQPSEEQQQVPETATSEVAENVEKTNAPDSENANKEEKKEEETEITETKVLNNDVTVEEEGAGMKGLLLLLILFLVGLMGGLLYLFLFQNNKPPTKTTPTTLKTVAVYTVTPTQTAAVNKQAYTIKVLNGSGVSGVAASAQNFLTESGYKVDTIDNADNSNYSQTTLQVKSSVDKNYIASLEKDLGTKYSVDTTTGSLDSSTTEDVVVIIGSEAAN